MSLNYTKKTLQHFRNPKNIGQLEDADATAQIGNAICGDQLFFSIKVKDKIIKDIKFLSFGCASNIATASVMTEMVKGKTLDEAKKLDWKKIVDELDGLPSQKIHCSVLALEGLRDVISNYEKKHPEIFAKKDFAVKKVKNGAGKNKDIIKKTKDNLKKTKNNTSRVKGDIKKIKNNVRKKKANSSKKIKITSSQKVKVAKTKKV